MVPRLQQVHTQERAWSVYRPDDASSRLRPQGLQCPRPFPGPGEYHLPVKLVVADTLYLLSPVPSPTHGLLGRSPVYTDVQDSRLRNRRLPVAHPT